jgi:hypothetical protein
MGVRLSITKGQVIEKYEDQGVGETLDLVWHVFKWNAQSPNS